MSVKIQQLRYLLAITQHGFNVSQAADELFTSQPGISKQIKLLEDELGVPLFVRHGKHFVAMTEAGEAILQVAQEVLQKADSIKQIADEFKAHDQGSLSIATTHTQARYMLPTVIHRFRQQYPNISLHIQQGTPTQIAEMAASGQVDIAIATEGLELFENLIMLPCHTWSRAVLVPNTHSLAQRKHLTLEQLVRYPLITYVFGFSGRSQFAAAFTKKNLHPDLVLTAVDADIIKTYVRLGLGVGIVAKMAYDAEQDSDLIALDASQLFGKSVTKIGWRRSLFMRRYIYEFVQLFAPHLSADLVNQALQLKEREAITALFAGIDLPNY